MTTITAQIPLEYSPDQQDSDHRKEQIPPTAFHIIGAGSQAIVVAGVFRKDGERGKGEKVAMKSQINAQLDHTRFVPTPRIYQPLEVILERKYDCGVDIWAMGLVGMEMLGCKLMKPPLVDGPPTELVKQRILDVIGLPNTKYQDIFQNCLSLERPRPGRLEAEIDTALDRMESDRNSSLTKANLKDLLLKLLDVNPQSRPRAYECLEHPYLLKMNVSL
ncbi:unnamed protein product, partial [Mesorhabditis belari]|uniref:Protein kinase domain-containing protein n=1 Tax=Mesorhabditis belari TaxID=2138241 RepID=A0AAF3EXG3_9BILA